MLRTVVGITKLNVLASSSDKQGMMHDCIITENWVVLALLPLCVSQDRLHRGGKHFAWDNDLPMMFGVLPRRNCKTKDVRWYPHVPNTFVGHFGNAFDIDKDVFCIDTPIENGNTFGAFFPVEGETGPPKMVQSKYVRFIIDTRNPSGTQLEEPEVLIDINGGMPRMDDRFVGLKYRYMYLSVKSTAQHARVGVELGKDEGGVAGSGFANSIGVLDVKKRTAKVWWAGPLSGVGEQTFVPRHKDAPEGDGYIVAVVSRFKDRRTELVILDTASFDRSEAGEDIQPVARIVLPFRMRSGVHGSWVPASALGKWQQICDMYGVDNESLRQFGDSVYQGTGCEPIAGHESKTLTNLGGDDEGHAPGAQVIRGLSNTISQQVNGINAEANGANGVH